MPLGTPDETREGVDLEPSMITSCVLADRKSSIQLRMLPRTP